MESPGGKERTLGVRKFRSSRGILQQEGPGLSLVQCPEDLEEELPPRVLEAQALAAPCRNRRLQPLPWDVDSDGRD